MVWTMYLLLGATAMTASAFIHEHFLSNSDHDPRKHYQQASTAPGPQHLHHESSRKSTRAVNDNSKIIVFPGPTSKPHLLDIPDDCKELGFCDNVGNYPHEQVRKAIEQLEDSSKFRNKERNFPELPDVIPRAGGLQENEELCNFYTKFTFPKAAIDLEKKWQIVLNLKGKFEQGFRVEICTGGPCLCDLLEYCLKRGLEGRCTQKFTFHKMHVLYNGTIIEKDFPVPTCYAFNTFF